MHNHSQRGRRRRKDRAAAAAAAGGHLAAGAGTLSEGRADEVAHLPAATWPFFDS